MKNKFAVALGKMNKGRKKTLTAEDRKRRAEALAMVRVKRWIKNEVTL